MISHIKYVTVLVSDQDRARSFYTQTLGFELIADEPQRDNTRWIEVGLPNTKTRIILVQTEEPNFDGLPSNIVYATDDIHATYETLDERGVSFTESIVETDWGAYAQFVDPDGNEFVLTMSDE